VYKSSNDNRAFMVNLQRENENESEKEGDVRRVVLRGLLKRLC